MAYHFLEKPFYISKTTAKALRTRQFSIITVSNFTLIV